VLSIVSRPDDDDDTNLVNSDRIEPSKAIRQQVRSDLNGNWCFARIIAEKPVYEDRQPMYFDLYARVNESGVIEDRVFAKVDNFQRMPDTNEKEYNNGNGYKAIQNEVKINALLARMR
jgi:hypothetical protein